ncbi:MAG: sugar porter family MFS transporter [Coxiellaceae bacterium]|nr:sugar porter family MFS transporter [Coxiellaceae bacterium]
MVKRHGLWYSWLMIGFAAIGGILYGYDLGIIAGAILFIRESIPMTDAQSSFLVAAVLGGGAIATLISGPLADVFGRKRMILVAAVIFLAGVLSLAYAHTYRMVLLGRLTQGVGVGIVTIIIPLYLAESLPANIRGRGISAFQLLLTFGILMASLVGLYFTPSGNWRGMFLSATVPGLILLVGGLLLPNSPRWLFNKGHEDKAYDILCKSRTHSHAQEEIDRMRALLKKSTTHWKTELKALCSKRYVVPVTIVMLVAMLQQLMGINSILQLSAYILKTGGLSSNITAMLGSTAITSINFLLTIAAFFLVDRIGRKLLLMIGTAGCMISLFCLGCTYFIFDVSLLKGYLLLAGIIGFITAYAIGPGVIVWLVISELLPSRIRSTGMSIALFINSMTSAMLASVFLPLAHRIGYYSVFMLCAIAAGIYFMIAFNVIPETKNKTLEEIEIEFGGEVVYD